MGWKVVSLPYVGPFLATVTNSPSFRAQSMPLLERYRKIAETVLGRKGYSTLTMLLFLHACCDWMCLRKVGKQAMTKKEEGRQSLGTVRVIISPPHCFSSTLPFQSQTMSTSPHSTPLAKVTSYTAVGELQSLEKLLSWTTALKG